MKQSYETLISVEDCNRMLQVKDQNLILFDCRFDLSDTEKKRNEYQLSHIPGAFYAHLDEQLSSPVLPDSGRHPMPDIQKLVDWLARCGFDGSQQVVVYDDSFGAMAVRLWWLLRGMGHNEVAVLDGGWPAWLSGGYQTSSIMPQNKAARYEAKFDNNLIVDTDDILRNLQSNEFLVLDVRARERFIGEAEPIDPVAGHIPGAVNMPLTKNLDDSGCFLGSQKLVELYQPVLDQYDNKPAVFMCGSGVTACHSVLAMMQAGFDMPRVYAGSWSEWIRDGERPIAKGP